MLKRFENYYLEIRANRWHWYFYLLCRLLLAFAFIAAGLVKIMGERFANGLAPEHPMGAYLVALDETGFYYTFIGFLQVAAALLVLIPRTVTIGALIYLPIIVNIWILTLSTRFDGSFVTSPLMVLATLYLLVWNYDRLRHILPYNSNLPEGLVKRPLKWNNHLPYFFIAMVVCCFAFVVLVLTNVYDVMPRNSQKDCLQQFNNQNPTPALKEFCDCIHQKGEPLEHCLDVYEREP